MNQEQGDYGGIRSATPRESWNAPGQREISYRAGTQEAFLRSMLARLSSGCEFPALQALTNRSDDDLTVALLDAWGVVADILTFYQERLANEAFLRTATEAQSIQYLARLLGYERKRGVAAATYLSFMVDEAAGAPLKVSLPAGLAAQSVPLEAGQLPQTYETNEAITVRAAWNSMRAQLRETQPIDLRNGSLYIDGTDNNLNTGDYLLFVNEETGEKEDDGVAASEWALRRLTDVRPDPESGRTRLFWSKAEQRGSLSDDDKLRLYVLRQPAAIFGHNAAQWSMLPDTAMADYLGIADPATLTPVEKVQWPDFIVPAPRYPLEAVPTIRTIPPTVDSVIAAVITACDGVNQGATMDALTALPNAAVEALGALSKTVAALLTIGSGLGGADTSGAGDSETDYDTEFTNFTENLNSFFTSLLPDFSAVQPGDIVIPGDPTSDPPQFPAIDFDELTNFFENLPGAFPAPIEDPETEWGKLASSFETFIESNPIVSSLLIFSDDAVLTALGEAADQNKAAADAILGLPGALAEAASAIFMAQAVKMAVGALATMPFPLPLTPKLVAFVAIFVARLLKAILNAGNLIGLLPADNEEEDETVKKDQTDDYITNVNDLLVGDENSAFVVEDDDLVDLAVAATLVSGAGAAAVAGTAVMGAAVGGALVGFGSIGGVSGLGALIIPAIGPILLAGATFVLLGQDIAEGANIAANTIVKAANEALKPAKEIARERFLRSEDCIDLDRQYNRISPDSWLVLQRPDAKAKLYRVRNVTQAARSEYNLNAQVTRVHLDEGTGSWFGLTPDGYNALLLHLGLSSEEEGFDPSLEGVPAYVTDLIEKVREEGWFDELVEKRKAPWLFGRLLGHVFESKTELDTFLDDLLHQAAGDGDAPTHTAELVEALKQHGLQQDAWFGLTPDGYNALLLHLGPSSEEEGFDPSLEGVPAYVTDLIETVREEGWFDELVEKRKAPWLFGRLLGHVFESKTELDTFLDVLLDQAADDDDAPSHAQELVEELQEHGLQQDAPFFPFHHEVRATAVLGHSDALAIADKPKEEVVGGLEIFLNDDVPRLPAGRRLIVTGPTAEPPHAPETEERCTEDSDPHPQPPHAAATEVVTVAACEKMIDGRWKVTLEEKGLCHRYQRDLVDILGNVAGATHGQSEEEVLGSGDGSAANQQFELSSGPLTYTPDESTSGRRSTLEVRVNGIRWREEARPSELQAGQEAYTTHVTPEGALLVRFGDGQAGGRLPTGQENVVARYRAGTGKAGNSPAEQITILRQRPPGLRGVSNPLPAAGGSDPEAPEAIRTRAPHSVRSFGRVVSLADYVDFATTFPGIGKAFATWYWRGAQKVIYLAFAPVGGEALEGKLLDDKRDGLRQALQEAGEPGTLLDLEQAALGQFGLHAGLWLDSPRYEKDGRLAAAHAALATTFSFERHSFGSRISQNEIIRCLQAVPGVVGVNVRGIDAGALSAAPLPAAGRAARPDPIPLWTINPQHVELVAYDEGDNR